MSKGYKWIVAERESLDPYVDYEKIWKLSTCYYVNDFMMNFLYTTGFPHFILPPHGGEVMYRANTGKAIHQPDKRESDTAKHFWRWFEMGPSDLATQQSIKQVNAIHQGIAKKYPGRYTNLEDFTYTMCWIGADMHRLRLRVGLSGYTENQKIATHLYWQEIAKLFRGENPESRPGNPVFDAPISDFPTSFDGMLEYMDKYEAIDYPYTEGGAATCEAIIDQFSHRWFPKGTRFLGRQMILSLLDESPHRVHRLPYPNVLVRKVMEFGFAAVVYTQERILPDPKLSTPEKHRRAEAGKKLREVAVA
ncbi:hypothetical protein O4328_28470 [Rhodococcus opacus]|uniref:ER-bound oxygenase mpaB/mpaB'/Rubber oxygenase catalytic domain-containing protein n=1 Tax=Rhodococcus opacus TaxID=37919 RepID=A0AAX3YR08_RHOOP|nr:hypothetical protein [Rhodococcus opacus]MCZ4587575.1 hypothetical protein [Rhodococcus opacus]WLF51423.1 hypothetical protein Q5707_37785 [Rhodococcus opacus]